MTQSSRAYFWGNSCGEELIELEVNEDEDRGSTNNQHQYAIRHSKKLR